MIPGAMNLSQEKVIWGRYHSFLRLANQLPKLTLSIFPNPQNTCAGCVFGTQNSHFQTVFPSHIIYKLIQVYSLLVIYKSLDYSINLLKLGLFRSCFFFKTPPKKLPPPQKKNPVLCQRFTTPYKFPSR